MSRHRDPDPPPGTERLAALVAGRTGSRAVPAAEVTDDPHAVDAADHDAAAYRVADPHILEDPSPDPGERERVHARPLPAARAAVAPVVLPESLRGARVAVSTRALLGVVAVLLLAAGVVGARVWWAGSRSEPVPVESVTATTPPPTGGTAPGQIAPPTPAGGTQAANPAMGAPPTPTAQVIVHVVGEVKKPGVVRVASTARVADAVRRCGGLTGAADATSVNLARPVVDGEQVVVRPKGATPAALAAPAPAPSAGTPGGAPGSPGSQSSSGVGAGAPGSSPNGPAVDLNAADQAALETLPGVGPVMAQRIVQWRAANGRFGSVDELAEVDGIGVKTLERLRPHVRV